MGFTDDLLTGRTPDEPFRSTDDGHLHPSASCDSRNASETDLQSRPTLSEQVVVPILLSSSDHFVRRPLEQRPWSEQNSRERQSPL